MNSIQKLFGIQYPIVQGGMIWCSGWKLASAVSNAGGLGLIGAGSMYPDVFREHVKKCKEATQKPFGVNIPLIYPQTEDLIDIILKEKVPVVFTSAGSPKKYTGLLKENGIKVAHVIANSKFAVKCEEAGVDAIVAEGFEAGGHNGYEETTSMALIPAVRRETDIPLIAAGGIATGRGMLAAMALGADGVQIGSRFAATKESSAHDNFKQAIVQAKEGDTMLSIKKLIPVRLIKNTFQQEISEMEFNGASNEELVEKLGKGRAKLGMFEGDSEEGEFEIGQISSIIDSIQPAGKVVEKIITEYKEALNDIQSFKSL
ncbi:MAG: nitronate monooxygenase [Marinilabiliales bacterium]|nr:MAG: nitronate monooxygenase [Marinilabiliales bacterium]